MSALADPSYATDAANEWDSWSASPSQASFISAPTIFRVDAPSLVDANWFQAAAFDFQRFVSRSRGWDSYDALPMTIESVRQALVFLANFLHPDSAPPTVVPLADGGVQLEWHRGGVDIEASFPVNDLAELYIRDLDSGDERELDLWQDYRSARPYASRLSA